MKRLLYCFYKLYTQISEVATRGLQLLKRLHWISFLIKFVYLRAAFLHYNSEYVSVWVKQKKTAEQFQNILLFNLWVDSSESLEFQTLVFNSQMFSSVLCSSVSIQYKSDFELLRLHETSGLYWNWLLGPLNHSDLCFGDFKILAH